MNRKVFLCISVLMFIFAIGFVIYALNNPQASFPWSNSITYAIYFGYFIAMVVFFVLSRLVEK